jgi:hypothetical protein
LHYIELHYITLHCIALHYNLTVAYASEEVFRFKALRWKLFMHFFAPPCMTDWSGSEQGQWWPLHPSRFIKAGCSSTINSESFCLHLKHLMHYRPKRRGCY